jgi:hypothetical protein
LDQWSGAASAQAPAAATAGATNPLLDRQMRAMPGNDKTWYVINTQNNELVSSNVGRKSRGHVAILGKQAAAQFIVDFWTGGQQTYRKFNFEVFKTEQQANARVAYWKDYDWRAGYR